MNPIKNIRERLQVTQTAMGEGMGCTQPNVGHYERGQTVPPEAAKQLIAFALSLGHVITLDHIYGIQELPPVEPASDAPAEPSLDDAMAAAAQAGLVERRSPERLALEKADQLLKLGVGGE